MNTISKKEALEKGLKYYFTGKTCKRGHISERMLCGICTSCHRQNGEDYRNNNRQKVREYSREYSKKNYSTEKRRISYINNIVSELYSHAKQRAKSKNLEFNITKDDIVIPKLCPVFNVILDVNNKLTSPTLDRIDNSLGYIKGNIKVISAKANRLKNNGTIEEFIKIITYMQTHSGDLNG